MAEFKPGLYRTTQALPGNDGVGAQSLVWVRTQDKFAPATVLLPARVEHNQWHFRKPGIRLEEDQIRWLDSLVSVPHEGFYRLLKTFSFGEGPTTWPQDLIVQLGYNRTANPILFVAQRRSPLPDNELYFGDKGVRLKLEQLEGLLAPLVWYQEPDKKAGTAS